MTVRALAHSRIVRSRSVPSSIMSTSTVCCL